MSVPPLHANQLSNVLCCFGILNALNLDQACAWVGVALAALVAQMAAPINIPCQHRSIILFLVRSLHADAAHCPCSSSHKRFRGLEYREIGITDLT
jgi:hypothetical protein